MSGFHAPTGYAKFNVWLKIIRLPLDLFLAAVNYLTNFCMSSFTFLLSTIYMNHGLK